MNPTKLIETKYETKYETQWNPVTPSMQLTESQWSPVKLCENKYEHFAEKWPNYSDPNEETWIYTYDPSYSVFRFRNGKRHTLRFTSWPWCRGSLLCYAVTKTTSRTQPPKPFWRSFTWQFPWQTLARSLTVAAGSPWRKLLVAPFSFYFWTFYPVWKMSTIS